MNCVDCGDPTLEDAKRCSECLEEVAESPRWRTGAELLPCWTSIEIKQLELLVVVAERRQVPWVRAPIALPGARRCLNCGDTLPVRYGPGRRRKYCSLACSRSIRRPGVVVEERRCVGCGDPLPPREYRGNPRKWCSTSCRAWAYNNPGKVRTPATCRRCGERLPPGRSAWCSQVCMDIANQNLRDPEALPRQRRVCDEPDCGKPHRGRGLCKSHYRKKYPAPCELRHDRARNQLKNHVRKRRLRSPEAEMIDRDAVGERDKWRCGICHRHVDRTKVYPHPRSPSLDHVIPQSQDGPHTWANVRISHLDCNVARSNLGGGEQLALFG